MVSCKFCGKPILDPDNVEVLTFDCIIYRLCFTCVAKLLNLASEMGLRKERD